MTASSDPITVALRVNQRLGGAWEVEAVTVAPCVAALVIRHARGCKVLEFIDLAGPVEAAQIDMLVRHLSETIALRARSAGPSQDQARAALDDLPRNEAQ